MNDTSQWTWPTLMDVLAAKQRIRPYLARTPLHRYSAINDLIGTAVYHQTRKLPARRRV